MRHFVRRFATKPKIVTDILGRDTVTVETAISGAGGTSITKQLESYIDELLSLTINYDEEIYDEIANLRENLLVEVALGKKLKDDPKLVKSFQKLDNFILSSPHYAITSQGRVKAYNGPVQVTQTCAERFERIAMDGRAKLSREDEEFLNNLYNSLKVRRRYLKASDRDYGTMFGVQGIFADIARTGIADPADTSFLPQDQRKRQILDILRYFLHTEELRTLGELTYQIDRDPTEIASKTGQSPNSALYYLPQSEWWKVTMRRDPVRIGINPRDYYVEKPEYLLGHREHFLQYVVNDKPVPASCYDFESMHTLLGTYAIYTDMGYLRSPPDRGQVEHFLAPAGVTRADEDRFVEEMAAIKVNGRPFFSRNPADNPIVAYGLRPYGMTAYTDDTDRVEVVDAILQNYHKSIAAATNPLEELDCIARTFKCLYSGHFFGDANGRACSAILNHMLSSRHFPLRLNKDIAEFTRQFMSNDGFVQYLIDSMREFNGLVVGSTGVPLPASFTDKVDEAERLLAERIAHPHPIPTISCWNYPVDEGSQESQSLKIALYIANMESAGITDSRVTQSKIALASLGSTTAVLAKSRAMIADEEKSVNDDVRKFAPPDPKFLRPDKCKAINVIADENPAYDPATRTCIFKVIGGNMAPGSTITVTNTDGIKDAAMRVRDRGIRSYDTDITIKNPDGQIVTPEFRSSILKKDEARGGWDINDYGGKAAMAAIAGRGTTARTH